MLRFCRKLGLRGLFRVSFSAFAEATEDQDGTAGNDADEILSGMITALHSTHELLNQETIQKAAEMILKARRLYALGSGNSGLAAQEFL